MTPFESWFSSDFQKAIRTVKSEPGVFSTGAPIDSASWDRKAAFMLWQALGCPDATYPSVSNPDPKEMFMPLRYEVAPTPAPSETIDLEECIAATDVDPLADVLG